MRELRLIHSRSTAAFAVFATGSLAYLTIRKISHPPPSRSPWLFPALHFLPHWTLYLLNAFFYGYILWTCFAFLRMGNDKERLVGLCYVATFLLGLIQPFFSDPVAASIQYVKGLVIGAAFLTTVLIALAIFVPTEVGSND